VRKEIALHRQEGKSIWMLGALMTFKATGAETDGSFSLVEQVCAPGQGSPPHVHHGEDEFLYIIEGEATFTLGDQVLHGKPGSFVFLPRDIPHQFVTTEAGPSRMLLGLSPAGFESFFEEIGEPAPSLTLPPPGAPDMEKLFALAKKYNAEILVPAAAS